MDVSKKIKLNIVTLDNLSVVIWLVFCTLTAMGLSGYTFGTGDQIIHIPFIKNLLNDALYSTDHLVRFMQGKPSLFWQVLILPISLMGIELSFVLFQFVSILLLFYSIYEFAFGVTGSRLAGFIAVLISVLPKYSFGYSSLIVMSHFIPRNLVIGPAILAVVLYLRKKKASAYLLLGFLTNMHALTTLPIIFGLMTRDVIEMIKCLLENKTINPTTFISALYKKVSFVPLAFIGMLPLVISKSEMFLNRNNTTIVSATDYVEFYTSIMKPFYTPENEQGVILLINAILVVILSVIWTKMTNILNTHTKQVLTTVCWTSMILVGISIISETIFKVPFLVQLQLGRAGNFTLLIFTTLLAYSITKLWTRLQSNFTAFLAIFIAILSPLLSPLIFIEVITRFKLSSTFSKKLLLTSLGIFALVNFYGIRNIAHTKHTFQPMLPTTSNVLAQEWIKTHTDKNSRIIAPYYIGGFTEPDFRTLSERTNILTNADVVETILNVNMLVSTRERLNDLTMNQFLYLQTNRKIFDYYAVRHFYHEAVITRTEYLKDKYNANYIVIEADYSLDTGDLVYANDRYKIYKI